MKGQSGIFAIEITVSEKSIGIQSTLDGFLVVESSDERLVTKGKSNFVSVSIFGLGLLLLRARDPSAEVNGWIQLLRRVGA